MRKIVLALILALTALTAGLNQAAAMDGFDLGDMPPLPPPLLDDSPPTAPPLTPPGSGSASPLVQQQPPQSATPPAASSLAPPPPAARLDTGISPLSPSSDSGFATPMPPAPPSLSAQPPQQIPAATGLAIPDQGGVPALAPAISAEPVVVFSEIPYPGKVTGERVNVRAGPNIQYESIAVLTIGTPVTVLAKHGDWYKIIFPASELASIHKNFVEADIGGEIPETGLPGTVNQDGADVHAFYWDKSTVVGKLNRGDPVVIKQERGQWYRIEAPESARAFISAQYVRVDGGADGVVADVAPPPFNPSVDPMYTEGGPVELKLSKSDMEVNALKEAHFKRMRADYEREIEEEERAAREAEERLKNQAAQLDLALEDLEARLKSIDEETGQRMGYIASQFSAPTITTVGSASWAPPDPVYGGYTGWVENIGRVGGLPASHRLTKAGELRFYLRSDSLDLQQFVGRRVWINGSIEPAAGGSANILNVGQIRVLTELEIAEGMQGGVQPGYVDPYAGGGYYAPPAGSDPYSGYGSSYTDPAAAADVYAGDPYAIGTVIQSPNQALPGNAAGQPAPQGSFSGPNDASQLPDIVGIGGQPYQGVYQPPVNDPGYGFPSSLGEVDSDFYEQPVISEILP